MKIKTLNFRSEINVKLESPDGDAVITFKRKVAKDEQIELADLQRKTKEFREAEQSDKVNDLWHDFFSQRVIRVEGITQDGEKITPEMIKNREVFPELLTIIYNAYTSATAGEADEKKEDSDKESSSAISG